MPIESADVSLTIPVEHVAGFGADGRGVVARRDRRRRLQHLLNQVVAAVLVADREQIGARL